MRRSPIPFQVRVTWNGEERKRPEKLWYETKIIGAKKHHITIVSPDCCTGELYIAQLDSCMHEHRTLRI